MLNQPTQPLQAPEEMPPLPSHEFARSQRSVRGFATSLSRPATVAGQRPPLLEAVYNPDSRHAGVPSMGAALEYSPVKPWARPPDMPRTASQRRSRPRDGRSHLGPGAYGDGGVPSMPTRPRSAAPALASPVPRFPTPRLPPGADAVYAVTMPPFKVSAAGTLTSTLHSVVPRFSATPGM